jgi:hypothetical protein
MIAVSSWQQQSSDWQGFKKCRSKASPDQIECRDCKSCLPPVEREKFKGKFAFADPELKHKKQHFQKFHLFGLHAGYRAVST